jgi:hypothetical protein
MSTRKSEPGWGFVILFWGGLPMLLLNPLIGIGMLVAALIVMLATKS